MNFHVLTLFPEMIRDGFETSITGRAVEKGLLSLETVNIRDFSVKRGSFRLSPLSFSVKEGEIFAILGRTGSGKTVLLEAISGMFPGDTGEILFDGTEVRKIPIGERKIGIVYQDYGLFPHMKVKENIGYGLKMHRIAEQEQERRPQIGEGGNGLKPRGGQDRHDLERALAQRLGSVAADALA